jgi:uncharacterized protein (TIGR03437 family)
MNMAIKKHITIFSLLLFVLGNQNSLAQSAYDTISDQQYERLKDAIIDNKGSVSQKWGAFYRGNVTSCNNNLEDLHPGVDIAEIENTPVFTPVGGEVVNLVRGGDCSSGSCLSLLAIYNQQRDKTYIFLHMKTFSVSSGTVAAGTQVGTIGKRGAGGYHVHYEVRDGRRTSAAPCISSTVDPYANTPLTNSPIPIQPPVSNGATNSWDFNSNGNYQGWRATHASATSVNSGILFIDPSGNDPYITSPPLARNVVITQPNAILYPFIKVKMASNGLDGTGAIYFKTASENYYDERKKVTFNVDNCSLCGNASFKEYTVIMSAVFGGNDKWAGTITEIRLDPTGSGSGSTNRDSIGVDYIRLAGWGDLGGGIGDESGPGLNIASHFEGQTVTTERITLSGSASDADLGDSGISSVLVNGVRAQGDSMAGRGVANWFLSLTLNPGPNIIRVTATDDCEMRFFTDRTITINYQTQNPRPVYYSVDGRVTNEQGGFVAGTTLTLTSSTGAWWEVSTEGNGYFNVGNLPAGQNYTITPSKTNHNFNPSSWTINNLSSNQSISFIARQTTYSISGRVTDTSGNGIDRVKMTLSGVVSWVLYTNVNGDYSFGDLPFGGSITLTAQKPTYSFPSSYLFINFGGNQIANFIGETQQFPLVYSSGVYMLPLRAPGSSFEQKIVAGGMARAVAPLSGVSLQRMFAAPNVAGQWPQELGGVTVTVEGRPARVLAISPSPLSSTSNETYYIDFAVPDEVSVGASVSLLVRHIASGRSWSTSVSVEQSAPALWASNGTVAGDAVAQNADNFTVIRWGNGASTDGNMRVALYGSGLRLAAARKELNVVGRNANGFEYTLPVEYAGPHPNLPGLDQIIVRITPFMAGGAKITIWIIGSEESQLTLPLGNGLPRF